ncbi:hypothetical protein EJP77_13525 [Paenibacillus zeisoli]|uniref:Pyrrolo-quinoline quinone repeat domain-containing protein n=1 Tax=Paenibacillus zeisoli TaxID=2496267 RepID=A0A3S1DWA1_9BACL|nr:PQQ-binding-like beta-propeller repeat protein [Paenibacillus zeisoli]RUT29837.1 hypothetical protein EJP77_13525 [Paenibacillus zeisoli]
MMNKYAKFISSAALVWLVAGTLTLGVTPSAVSAERATLSKTYWTEPAATQFSRPAWTVTLSASHDEQQVESRAAAGEGQVYIVNEGKLIARDVSNGRQTWSFGNKLSPIIEYNQGTLYGTYDDGRVYAVSSKGAIKWVSIRTVTKAERLILLGDTLYILRGIDIFAFDARNGALKWENHDTFAVSGSPELTEQEGVVFRTYTGIANFMVTLKAFDAKNGTLLWEKSQQHLPIQVRNGSVYSVYEPNLFEEPQAELSLKQFDLKTGREKENYLYNWSNHPAPCMYSYTNNALIEGNNLYAFSNHTLVKFDLTRYTGNADQPDQEIRGTKYEMDNPLMKLYKGRLFYEERSKLPYTTHKSINISDGSTVEYQNDNPAAQVEVLGNGVYMGQTDGVFRAYELTTGTEVFAINTGARNYGPTEFEQGMAIIQTDHQLIGVALPGNLK